MRTARFSGHLFGGGSGVCSGSAWGCLPRSPRGQTDACENITLPQTSFAGGNKQQKG